MCGPAEPGSLKQACLPHRCLLICYRPKPDTDASQEKQQARRGLKIQRVQDQVIRVKTKAGRKERRVEALTFTHERQKVN